ncbi:hypothetical protein HYFRA_00005109 [Hymenoscyphus fraxineus]|uniref:Uncharacterized protein n=1 Tax=Hymenoscyphus fraxineus TaxID=746836 RepID=A0A9N9L866_9HELO|nr:hypothetical protein HYFRA_00005109 [Hymenoscyphus fraxineus]
MHLLNLPTALILLTSLLSATASPLPTKTTSNALQRRDSPQRFAPPPETEPVNYCKPPQATPTPVPSFEYEPDVIIPIPKQETGTPANDPIAYPDEPYEKRDSAPVVPEEPPCVPLPKEEPQPHNPNWHRSVDEPEPEEQILRPFY